MCGLAVICIVLCFCAWRVLTVNWTLDRIDQVITRKEIEFHQILLIQQEVRDNQRETLRILYGHPPAPDPTK